jgi:hypothetical protein
MVFSRFASSSSASSAASTCSKRLVLGLGPADFPFECRQRRWRLLVFEVVEGKVGAACRFDTPPFALGLLGRARGGGARVEGLLAPGFERRDTGSLRLGVEGISVPGRKVEQLVAVVGHWPVSGAMSEPRRAPPVVATPAGLSRRRDGRYRNPAGGGGGDAFTAAIGHHERDGTAVLDPLYETTPPFSPANTVAAISGICREYRVSKIIGDGYANQRPVESFSRHGIRYEKSELDRKGLSSLRAAGHVGPGEAARPLRRSGARGRMHSEGADLTVVARVGALDLSYSAASHGTGTGTGPRGLLMRCSAGFAGGPAAPASCCGALRPKRRY